MVTISNIFSHSERYCIVVSFARDRLRYHDDIFCAAGIVVRALHEEATRQYSSSPSVQISDTPLLSARNDMISATAEMMYHALHIRREDFLTDFPEYTLSAEDMLHSFGSLLNLSVTSLLYIATDETNLTFFHPFKKLYQIRFFKDFLTDLSHNNLHLNPMHDGMIEQIICANSYTFIGTPRSSFTSYITRLRGYYKDGRYARTYYTTEQERNQLYDEPDLIAPFWAREFAVAHTDIDDDMNPPKNDVFANINLQEDTFL
mmetsp:Transcript_16225/g.16353  ORF Transcript_16225/g.16353 Transcript_16225/m.16353 type:complete len:260 (+) Transcript_16225:210-989(+)